MRHLLCREEKELVWNRRNKVKWCCSVKAVLGLMIKIICYIVMNKQSHTPDDGLTTRNIYIEKIKKKKLIILFFVIVKYHQLQHIKILI